ncbi:hypothetical protein DSO57_1025470 [Entomophthora muscae]|uniref:Uncharacterized protein n=1 Tax=Entomophthora muscae TaxID=34485 RepID=A0ACC2RGZ8_9FUNG|nr:hypothetical protein DSO57_1025470 [Entomophthora muscae]
MSTASENIPASKSRLPSQSSMSDAEKLKKRREARNKRILASGSDRLSRIVGLAVKPKPTFCSLDSINKDTEDAPRSPIMSGNFYSEPNSTQEVNKNSIHDKSETERAPDKEQQIISSAPENCQEESVFRHPMLDSESFSANNNPLVEAILKTLSEDKRESPKPENDELSHIETPDMQELIGTMFPHFMAQPAADAFQSILNESDSAPQRSTTRKASKSIWSPDGRLGTLSRQLFLVALVMSLLNVQMGLKQASEWEAREYEDVALIELPLLGSIKPYHVLLSIEIGLQTQRYFFSQAPQRLAPQGMPGSIKQVYELFKFYSAAWTSMVDDFCLVVFLIGLWVLFEPLLLSLRS